MEARFVSALEKDGTQLRAGLEQTRALVRSADGPDACAEVVGTAVAGHA